LDSKKIEAFVDDKFNGPEWDNRFFLCGPQGIMDLAKETLLAAGYEKERLYSESFYLAPSGKEIQDDINGQVVRSVTIILDGQEHIVEVIPGKTILEAGLAEDLDMPYSCQSGLCTACRGKLLSGEVKMNEDAGLSENEIKEGYILCCSARPTSPNIRINIE
jgi:ring-1,2-phenylacetyl-CoA epoxidase subunit PaaE